MTPGLAATDSALFDSLATVRWPARRAAPQGMPGRHIARILGVSSEFTEYRAYRQGDDTRRIDWKLLARSNRAYIRLSHDRTVLPTIVLLDASASLAYPADSLEKWRYARQVVLGLAAAAQGTGDPVGIVVATPGKPRQLPPRTRRTVVHEIARVIDAVGPEGGASLAALVPVVRGAGRIAIVSDFLGDVDALIKAAGQLAVARKEVHAIHVVHHDELDPPKHTTLLLDPEDPAVRRPVTAETRRRYLESYGQWRERIARDWRAAGAYFTQVVTSEPVVRVVRRITRAAPGAAS